jgi:predicted DNA-binding transcriptional regulator AlpA
MQEMFEAQLVEFPFMAEMPKRERSKMGTLWDRFTQLKEITEKKGMLLPVVFCSKLLGVSRQRVYDLLKEGRMERVEVEGQMYITEESFVAWCKAEHKAGRPVRALSLSESKAVARDMMAK